MKKNRIRLTESQLHRVIKESVKKVLRETKHRKGRLNEIQGWSLEPDDFIIIGGEIDPNKTYMLIKISTNGGLMTPYVVEYDDYYPSMLNAIFEQEGYDDTFRDIQEYYNDIHEIMDEDGCDEEHAEYLASDFWIPCHDYDFAVYAPYGCSNSKPMSGAEMQENIDGTANDNWLKH